MCVKTEPDTQKIELSKLNQTENYSVFTKNLQLGIDPIKKFLPDQF